MKVRHILVVGNEVKPNLWEGNVSAEDMDCEQISIEICRHDHAYRETPDSDYYCNECKANLRDRHWIPF